MTPPPLRPARVLMTADAVGGVWHYAVQLARWLAERDVRTILATMGPPPTPAQSASAAAVPGLVHRHADYRLEWMSGANADFGRAAEWLFGLEREHAPDVVHLNGYCHAVVPFDAPVVVTAHSCVLSWWRAVHGEDAPHEWAGYARAVARGLQAADAVIAPTAAFLAMLEPIYGPLTNACVIHNGRPPADFRPAGRKEPFILTAGRLWDGAKNVSTLAAIAPRLSWPVVAAGDARGPTGGTRAAGGLRMLGPLDAGDLAGWMGRAAIFASPARYEPFGLAVLEAALSGCGLVLGDIPTFRELWDGVASFAPPDDEERLHQALEGLAGDPVLLAARRRAARRRALRLTADRTADRTLRVYATLIEAGSGTARRTPGGWRPPGQPKDSAACAL